MTDGQKAVLRAIENLPFSEAADLIRKMDASFYVVADLIDSTRNTYSVLVTDCGFRKIQVIKTIRELTSQKDAQGLLYGGLGLKEAKDASESLRPVAENVTRARAEEMAEALRLQGATVLVR